MISSLCFHPRKKSIGEFSFLLAGFDASQVPVFKVGLSVRTSSIQPILTSLQCAMCPQEPLSTVRGNMDRRCVH